MNQDQLGAVAIFSIGNPSRGDDALGPCLHERLVQAQQTNDQLANIYLIEAFQLQPENICDFEAVDLLLFIDASVGFDPDFDPGFNLGFKFAALRPERSVGYTTHSMEPASLLALYEQTEKKPAPAAYLLSIGARQFELGAPMSAEATQNLNDSWEFLQKLLRQRSISEWNHYARSLSSSQKCLSSSQKCR